MTKKRKELLNEDFLSDMEQKPVSAEDVAGAPENVADDDFADLLGGKTTQEPQAAQAAEENLADTVSALKDTVNGFSVAIQEFKDYIAKQNAAPAEPAAPVEPEAPAPAPEASPDAPPNIDLDNAPAEGGEAAPEAPAEQSIEDKPAEGGESAPAEGGEEESDFSQDESRPEDATKSEAYQMNRKAGKLLNSNSGTLIGIVESGKLYKLDEMIMTAVKSKIREKINEAKAQLKAEFLKEAAEMPKAEPEMIVEEKKEEEKKPEKKTMSFLEKLKAAKACKGKACCDEKKEECKGSDDDKKDDDKKEDEKKED